MCLLLGLGFSLLECLCMSGLFRLVSRALPRLETIIRLLGSVTLLWVLVFFLITQGHTDPIPCSNTRLSLLRLYFSFSCHGSCFASAVCLLHDLRKFSVWLVRMESPWVSVSLLADGRVVRLSHLFMARLAENLDP